MNTLRTGMLLAALTAIFMGVGFLIGSTLSVLISMAHGFTATFLAGLLAYALALAVVRVLWRTDRASPMAERELVA